MDRRHFLSTSLIAIPAVAGMTAESPLVTPSAMAFTTPARQAKSVALTEATFRSQVGSRFDFASDGWRGSLQLTDVVARTSDAQVEQFTTVFKTTGKVAAASGLYNVNHPELGRFMLRIDGNLDSDRRVAEFALLRG